MRKWTIFGRLTASVLAAVLLTACGDDTSMLEPPTVRGLLIADTVITDFAVGRSGGRFNIGATHRIEFPANAICDIPTSSYGAGEWDAPCTPTTALVRIRAKTWTDAAGYPHVDFEPAMRFSPTLSDGVVLYLRDKRSSADPSAKILYCTGPLNLSCVDESASDPTVAVRRDAANGFVYRRIKHFSGYNVSTGFVSDAEVMQ